MVEIMKITATSFKRSLEHTAVLSASDPEAGHSGTTPPLETPEHSWACLGQFLVGSLLLSPGSCCTQGFVCALQESLFSQSCGRSAIKSHCQTQIPWGFSVPLMDLQVGKFSVRPRTFATV